VNTELVPAVAAATGGSALLAGIWLHEHRQGEAMRAGRIRLGLRFPTGLEPVRAFAALDGLSGLPYGTELVAEVVAGEGRIEHFLWVPGVARSSVESILTGVIPSLRVSEASPTPAESATLALRLFVPTPSVLSTDNAEAAARSLLAGMAILRGGESVAVKLALRPGSPRSRREPDAPTPREREIARAWQRKTAVPGFGVSGLVLIRAAKMGRARELAAHIENVLRARRGIAGGFRITYGRGYRSLASLPKTTRTSGWLSNAELLGLLGWPLGADVAVAGVELGGRELAPAAHLATTGRRLFVGRDLGGERWVALEPPAARLHTAVVGSSGSGKSELLARGILDEIAAGHAGVVIDPKADLVQTVLERVPAEHAGRVVVLDPGDDSRPTPGVAVLSGGDIDLRADVLTGAVKSIFADVWGVRSDYYMHLAIRSLAEVPGATLADVGRLFTDQAFLHQVIARLRDPFLLGAWEQYLELPAGSRVEHVQAPMARVMALLARPRVRAVLANPEPKLDIGRLFAERKWLLVSLAPGQLGEAGASIIGASVTHLVWSAIEARVSLPAGKRPFISVYLDELATLTGGVPFSFELLAERARGLGAGLTVAVQTLGRVPEPTRSALLGNTATFISFRAGAEEAPRIARQLPGLGDGDVMALGRFHVAARVASAGSSSVVTGRTLALPPATGQADVIRDRSAKLYGSSPVEPVPPTSPSTDTGQIADDSRLGRRGRAA
jgi:hypothetical protein